MVAGILSCSKNDINPAAQVTETAFEQQIEFIEQYGDMLWHHAHSAEQLAAAINAFADDNLDIINKNRAEAIQYTRTENSFTDMSYRFRKRYIKAMRRIEKFMRRHESLLKDERVRRAVVRLP